ncbi:MAG: sugar-transfer associated ATP-grasp domain-containing protein [Tissierellia bacterium]|nr:sugar-transfer associated ATP-grasp domain-containing protein [Tissierellia bacterium]
MKNSVIRRIGKYIYYYLKRKISFYSSTRAFNRRYKNYKNELFKINIDDNIIKKYREKWSKFGEKVEIDTLMLSYNLSSKLDYNIVPENLFAAIIEKELNPYKELSFFSLKNMYEKWFNNKAVFPKSYLHKIDGVFYDSDFKIIRNIDNIIEDTDFDFPIIVKPSKDSYGGAGVSKINSKIELKNKISEYQHLVCQELITQNEYLSKINNSSVNSVRSCLYRDSSGSFKVLNNSMRFGINGGLDNETSGGIVCNIHDNGKLNIYAVDKYANKFYEHPNSLIRFDSVQVPFYEELNNITVDISNQIPLCNLVSLDMCLDNDNNWRCLEMNLSGQTIRFAQYAGKGFFGKYTEEVIKRTTRKFS